MITITPTAGLCNRMRALDSALALGRAASVPVRMVWKRNFELNCPFEELFEAIPGLVSIKERMEGLKPPSSFVRKTSRIRRSIRATISRTRFINQPESAHYADKPEALIGLAAEHDLDIDTYERFFRGSEDYQGFRPSAGIREKVEEYKLKSSNIVAVHIRRGDSKPSWIYSPTRGYIASMRSVCEADPSVRFFVASDSAEAEDELESAFPGRIVRQPKASYAREDPEGIKHAMVDLYCLASCRRFIGSYWSSFTDTALEIGKMPFEMIYCPPAEKT